MGAEQVSQDWLAKRGIPFAPEVQFGYRNDGPMNSEVAAILGLLLTNMDKPVFAYTDRMGPEMGAALFTRYSRSARPLRLVWQREFKDHLTKPQEYFAEVLASYGDDSPSQLGIVSAACEMVSQLAVKEIEDGRLAAYIEKSTRYVSYAERVNGHFLYFRPPEIMQSPLAADYTELMDEAFTLYGQVLPATLDYVKAKFPNTTGQEKSVYLASVRAKAYDIIRVFLPMATLTNVGGVFSAQSMESMLNKMATSPLTESRWLADEIKREVDQVIPSLVARVGVDKYGGATRSYLHQSRQGTQALAEKLLSRLSDVAETTSTKNVELVSWDREGVNKVVAAILFPHAHASLADVRQLANSLTDREKLELVNAYVAGRTNRRHKPGRAFEHSLYELAFKGKVAEWRDLQRQRMLTQHRQKLTPHEGFATPPELDEIQVGGRKVGEIYAQHMQRRAELYERVATTISPEIGEYLVAFGHYMRWSISTNLREVYHMVPLRAQEGGHPDYRRIAREMYYEIAAVHPILALPMEKLIDFSDEPRLDRLNQLAKVKEKLDRLKGQGLDTFSD